MAGTMVRGPSKRAWSLWSKVGLHARLETFILLALLPLAGLVILLVLQERGQEIERARHSTILLAERGAAQQAEVLQQARGALQMLTLVPEVRMAVPDECVSLLQQVTALHPWSTGFSVVQPDGQLLCDSDNRSLSIADREYFQRALVTKRFTLSAYLIGRASGKPVLVAVLPTLDDVGKVDRVLLAGVDLKWLAGLSAEAAKTTGGAVTLLDAHGTVLAREPDPTAMVGQSVAEQPIIQEILRNTTGVVEGVGLDGATRIIGFAPLGDTGARIAVGIAREAAVAEVDRKLLVSTGVMVGVVLVLVIGVWFLMEVSVLRGLRALQASAARLSSGQFASQHPCAPDKPHIAEIGAVARAVRDMGLTLSTYAFEDRLTGLANRRSFDGHLQRLKGEAVQSTSAVAILYLDLDGFKPVNDAYGHHVGDAVLVEVGARLAQCTRHGDLAARLGGDEFAVVMRLPSGLLPQHALDVASRIINGLSAPFLIEGEVVHIGCSVGVALWPVNSPDLDTACRYADQALYTAKRAGRGRAVLYADMRADLDVGA